MVPLFLTRAENQSIHPKRLALCFGGEGAIRLIRVNFAPSSLFSRARLRHNSPAMTQFPCDVLRLEVRRVCALGLRSHWREWGRMWSCFSLV